MKPVGQPAADLVGQTFGKLVVVARAGRDQRRRAIWECRCSCARNRTLLVSTRNLRRGATTSCGCKWQEAAQGRRKQEHTVFGATLTAKQIADLCRIAVSAVYAKLREGLTAEEIVLQQQAPPSRKRKRAPVKQVQKLRAEGLTLAEIAERLDVSLSYVKHLNVDRPASSAADRRGARSLGVNTQEAL